MAEERKVLTMEEKLSKLTDEQKNEYIKKLRIRELLDGFYDLQKLRIANGNRIVASFNIQMGILPSSKIDTGDVDVKLLEELKAEYKRITDAYVNKSYILSSNTEDAVKKVVKVKANDSIVKVIDSMTSNNEIKFIRTKVDFELIQNYMSLCESEKTLEKVIAKEVKEHPMWDRFFVDVKGCGPLMAAVCIAYFDIHQARYASSFHKYAGLDVVPVQTGTEKVTDAETGETAEVPVYKYEGRAMRHTEMVPYITKDGKQAEKRSITYNPFLKTKLVGVLGDSFVKKPDGKYGKIYRDYKARLDNRPDTKDFTKMHKHRMAVRYAVKMFLADLWTTWRAYEGYEIPAPYVVDVLGQKPHGYNEFYDNQAK